MTKAVFEPVPNSIDFAENDRRILKFWEDKKVFKRSESKCENGKHYVFYDGPPGTNGKPHIGHIMQSALKDVWPRFKTMQGYAVLRKAGWDTHGLPVELTAEAELKLKSKKDIEAFGVQKFIDYCRNTVLRFRSDWVAAISRLGRFADFENDYLTMSNDFIQSDWWVMQQAFKQNLIYKDFKVVPYCSRCGTGLSSHEVAQGYDDITDLTITAKFKLVDDPSTSILAWTTTPWTLLGNLSLAVNAELEYSKIQLPDGSKVILASSLIEKNAKALGKDYEIISTMKGSELEGLRYQPLWDPKTWTQKGDAHKVVTDEYVTAEDGTGVVHLAMYGEDDFRLIKKFGLKQVQHVGLDGIVNDLAMDYKGRFFKEEGLDVDIVKDLAARGLLFDKYRYEHSYPHCWRCKTPLMYYAKASWFIKTTAFKDVMLSENEKINWQPPHLKHGRFGNWLENNVDWAVSRDRYWGSPLPIWTHEKNSEDRRCYSSIKELQDAGAYLEDGKKPIPNDMDLHLPVIDQIVVPDGKGGHYRRESGVLDCWYNAGVMPWGQLGYPAAPGSKEIFANQYPADFICEAIDQTRGWFYTLLAVSCLVDKTSSFKNVICTELILDGNGKKMSKSLGNVIDPLPLIEEYGADAVRWTFYDSNPWQVKRYSTDIPKEALRAVFIPIWNCYSFFVTYAELDKWDPNSAPVKYADRSELDRWILSALKSVVREVSRHLEAYDIASAANEIHDFIDALSNWYIRRSRRRFWKSEDDSDKKSAYSTLYEVLVNLAHLIAPLAPFLAETIYQNLVVRVNKNAPDSIHLAKWPDVSEVPEDEKLEEEVRVIQEAASLARALRTEHNLKVRQPLQKLVLVPQDKALHKRLEHHLSSLEDEINVKEVSVFDDSADFISYAVKPNWGRLGPRYGELMKVLGKSISALSEAEIGSLRRGTSVKISVEGKEVEIEPEDVAISNVPKAGMIAEAGKYVTVALTTELTPALITEGHARELLSAIQRQRKTAGFAISDKVDVRIWGGPEIKEAAQKHSELLTYECLAKSIVVEGPVSSSGKEAARVDVNGLETAIEVTK